MLVVVVWLAVVVYACVDVFDWLVCLRSAVALDCGLLVVSV